MISNGGVGFELKDCFLGQSTVVVSKDNKQITVKVAKGNDNLTPLNLNSVASFHTFRRLY